MARLRTLLLTTNEYVRKVLALLAETELDYKLVISPDYPDEKISDIDVVLAYCYPKLIKEPFLTGVRLGTINFHPGPLPAYRGFSIYNFCILNNECFWGVTAHYMDKGFDTGDMIYRHEFPIQVSKITAASLRDTTHVHLLQLFGKVVKDLVSGCELPRIRQGSGNYYSREMLEKHSQITDEDSDEIVHRKVRAFWCPPHPGAYIKKGGKKYTLVTDEILRGNCNG